MSDFYKMIIENMSNSMFEDEIKLLYGEGSKIKINHCNWSINQKKYVIHLTLSVKFIDESVDAFPEGVEYIIEETWKFIGIRSGIVIVSSIT